jgi:hypothetical protein
MLLLQTDIIIAQITFNKRVRYNFPACVITGVVPTETSFFVSGMITDSMQPFNASLLFIELDLAGDVLTVSIFTDSVNEYAPWAGDFQREGNGNFVLPVHSSGLGNMTSSIFKYDGVGNVIFAKHYENPVETPEGFMTPRAGMVVLPDGGYVLVNWADAEWFDGYNDIYVIRTDSVGTVIWDEIISGAQWDRPESVRLTPDNKILIGATETNDNTTIDDIDYRCKVYQMNLDGEVEWTWTSTPEMGNIQAAYDILPLADSSVYIATANCRQFYNTSGSAWSIKYLRRLIRLNKEHEVVMDTTYGYYKDIPNQVFDGYYGLMTNLIMLKDSTTFVAAGSEYYNDYIAYTVDIEMGTIDKYHLDGTSIWSRKYGIIADSVNQHEIYDIKETSDGGFIIVGESKGYNAFPQQGWLLKIDSMGCLIPGCGATPIDDVVEVEVVAHIFPNPTSDYLNFELRGYKGSDVLTMRVVDMAGQVIRTRHLPDATSTYIVPVYDWPEAAFVLQVFAGQELLCAKVFEVTN